MIVRRILRRLSKGIELAVRGVTRLLAVVHRSRFGACGRNVSFDPYGFYTYETIQLGDNVNLGYRPILMASKSTIVIGNDVMFGPHVTIRGGNHRVDLLGRTMIGVTDAEGRPEDDPGVVIGNEVWIGTNATSAEPIEAVVDGRVAPSDRSSRSVGMRPLRWKDQLSW